MEHLFEEHEANNTQPMAHNSKLSFEQLMLNHEVSFTVAVLPP